jgi:predicted branched-subunit amino acid permease
MEPTEVVHLDVLINVRRVFFCPSLPLAMQASHLDKRGYEGQLACDEEGLKYVRKKVNQRVGEITSSDWAIANPQKLPPKR